jgi:alpha-tubulin suppressor-like RCC1 family protein
MRLLSLLLPTVVAFIHVDTGTEFTCARMADNTVSCWGLNDKGQFGNNNSLNSNHPVPGALNSTGGQMMFADIATGSTHACGFTSTGALYCWGLDEEGQQGDGPVGGPATTNFIPSFVLNGVQSTNLGHQHTCAVQTLAKTVACWGRNLEGQIGNGRIGPTDPVAYWTPQQVLAQQGVVLRNVTAVSCGYKHSCAIFVNRTVGCWGAAADGILGPNFGVTGESAYPVMLPLSNVIYVASGINIEDTTAHACAIFADSSLGCWGKNNFRQLGDFSFTADYSMNAIMVRFQYGTLMMNVTNVGCGGRHTCAVLSDGTLYCWGENAWGQLGLGNFIDAPYPTRVNQTATVVFTTVTQVAASEHHTCVTTNGPCSVYCWGSNAFGKLGISVVPDINMTRPRCAYFVATSPPTSKSPTYLPTAIPTYAPTTGPTHTPTNKPTYTPTYAPSMAPTGSPTPEPYVWPTLCEVETNTHIEVTTTAMGVPIPGYDGTYVLPCNADYGPNSFGSGSGGGQGGPGWPVTQSSFCGFPGVPCLVEHLFCYDFDPLSPDTSLECDQPAATCGGRYRWFIDYDYLEYASDYSVEDALSRVKRWDRDFITSGSSGNSVDECDIRTSTMPTSSNPDGTNPFLSCLLPDGNIEFNVQSLCAAEESEQLVMALCLLDPTSTGVCACRHSLTTSTDVNSTSVTSVDS